MDNKFNHNRRKLLAATGLMLPAMAFPSWVMGSQKDSSAIAQSAQGKLQGSIEQGVFVFKGIPYAGSVSGPNNRFKAPPAPLGWTGIKDATQLGAPAIQNLPPFGFAQPKPSEDCLFLNVWTPALDGRKRPVMVYQHGGGFVIGSGGAPWQDGAALAREHDVVVVQSNHRLGIMGYLYLGELLGPEYQGNQGLQDLVAALQWVNINIAEFGGDPDNVMIFGESGGGGKTSALYTMPSAAPYFQKASIESPIGPGSDSPADATSVALEVMRRLEIKDPAKLLTVPAAQLLKAQVGDRPFTVPGRQADNAKLSGNPEIMFWPFIDGNILPEEPFRHHAPAISANKPLIIGTCKDESVFFHQNDKSAFSLDDKGLKARLEPLLGARTHEWITTFKHARPQASPSEIFIAITTAKPWRAHANRVAESKAVQAQAPVYSYILDYHSAEVIPGTNFAQGSPHASDIPMKFNTAPLFGPKTPERLQTAKNMSAYWASFAHNSKPTASGQPDWQPYTLQNRETLLIDAECRMQNDPEGTEREFWSKEARADQEF